MNSEKSKKILIIAAVLIAVLVVIFIKKSGNKVDEKDTKQDTVQIEEDKNIESESKEEKDESKVDEKKDEESKTEREDEVKEDESKEEAETDAANSWGYESLKENDAVEEISKGDFDLYDTTDISLERYKEYKIPIIITFGSETCIYCRQMEPDLMNLNKELRGKALIKYVDIIRNKDFAEMFPIQATPATILIDAKGNPFDPSDDYSKFIYKYKANDSDEHGLSMAYGKLSKDQLKEILGEMNNAE